MDRAYDSFPVNWHNIPYSEETNNKMDFGGNLSISIQFLIRFDHIVIGLLFFVRLDE